MTILCVTTTLPNPISDDACMCYRYPPTPGKCEPVNTLSPTDSFPQPSSPPSSTSVTTQQQPPPSQQHQRPIRRRREMQAITKIVETREYPYVDGFFWKNNGNTVQKKTGNKSIYYKCSNSGKVCNVKCLGGSEW